MNEIMNVMKERRSIRKFKPDMPSKEDLNQIIEAGLYAASGMGKQAAIIVAVTNKELRDKLSEMKALDLGSIWIHRAIEEFELPEYKQLLKDLGVEGEWEGIGHCVVGYADGDLPKAAPRKENRVFWVE